MNQRPNGTMRTQRTVQSSIQSVQCTGAETWAANWASLLSTKTSEGAYSHLKMFVPADIDMGKAADDDEENDSKKRKRGADAEAADGPAGPGHGGGAGPGAQAAGAEAEVEVGADVVPVRSQMTLSEISSKGMEMVEETDEYQQLYSDREQMTAMSIKLLEMQLTSFLWDWVGFGFMVSRFHVSCPLSTCPHAQLHCTA